MDEKLAELIGIILGDGSIGIYNRKARTCKQFRLKITLNSEKDLKYSKYVSRIIYDTLNVKPKIYFRKNEKTLDIIITNKIIVKKLLEIGLKKSPKWKTATIPKEFRKDKLALRVLRGYMDTDGCISVFNNNGILYPRIEMKICPSPMQKQIIKILENNKFDARVNDIGKGKKRVMLAGRKKLAKWKKLIGFSNERNINVANRF